MSRQFIAFLGADPECIEQVDIQSDSIKGRRGWQQGEADDAPQLIEDQPQRHELPGLLNFYVGKPDSSQEPGQVGWTEKVDVVRGGHEFPPGAHESGQGRVPIPCCKTDCASGVQPSPHTEKNAVPPAEKNRRRSQFLAKVPLKPTRSQQLTVTDLGRGGHGLSMEMDQLPPKW